MPNPLNSRDSSANPSPGNIPNNNSSTGNDTRGSNNSNTIVPSDNMNIGRGRGRGVFVPNPLNGYKK